MPRCAQISRSGAWINTDGALTDSLTSLYISVLGVSESDTENFLYSIRLMPLSINSITQATGYKFKREDQSIYLSKDLCEFVPRRQWPEITLPVPTEAPPQPAPLGSNTQLIRAMQSTHITAADILKSQGTDPCAVYRESQVEIILNHVETGHKECRVFKRVLSSTQKLRSHIRSEHCHKAAYKCSVCSKPFRNPYALSLHKRVHADAARKFVCVCCGSAYLSKSKLNEHEKKHSMGRVTCNHCGKSLVDKKSLIDHLKSCKKVPGYEKQSEEELKPHKCPDCFRHYVQKEDMQKHYCKVHSDK